jgi:uncharacterized protein
MFTYTGKTALITGASSGIGEAFARELGRRGMSLILVARSEKKLQTLAAEIAQKYKVQAEVIVADLSQAGAASQILQAVEQRKLTVDLLINNAGLGLHGAFETLPANYDQQQVMVNVAAVVDLSRAFIPSMLKRTGETAIINVASTAGLQPIPYMAVYGATKAFVVSFSEALAEEYRNRNLRVLALCPGATQTAFFETSGEAASAGATRRTSEQVVATGLRALEKGRTVVVDGIQNSWMGGLHRVFPRWMVTRIVGQMVRPH